MFKQFSFLTPLQSSEREIKMVERKYKKPKFDINKYRESNWINAWGATPKIFSNIPLLHSKPYKTAEFLKPVKKKKKYNLKQKSLIRLNSQLKNTKMQNKWLSLLEKFKIENFHYLITVNEIIGRYLKLENR